MRIFTRKVLAPITLIILATQSTALQAQSLAGSRASMERQHQEAVRYGYTFIKTGSAVNQFVNDGHLVRVSATRHMDLHAVSYPYARPEVKLFLDRLSTQYQAACNEKLTVTSLTRPIDRQPANAANDSVHPTGMAVDLRIPGNAKCRSWLEKTLLSLEGANVLDVTRERHPPHYHVAVFTQPYQSYVASLGTSSREYVVRRGDTLSRIASQQGTTIAQLRSANGLRTDLINIGQKLQIPVETVAGTTAVAAQTREGPAATAVAARHEVEHRVRRGETLWRIANRYGTSVDMLRQENGLVDDFLDVGQVLRVTSTVGNP